MYYAIYKCIALFSVVLDNIPDTATPTNEPDTATPTDEPDTATSTDEPDTATPTDEPDGKSPVVNQGKQLCFDMFY